MPTERLTLTTEPSKCRFQIAQAQDGKPVQLEGYAIVWGAVSDDRGGFRARFSREGLNFTDPVLALYSHDTADVLGTTANKTLTLAPDDYGLKATITPPDTTYARDVIELVKSGYVAGMSFGVFTQSYTAGEEDGEQVRTYDNYTVDEVTITGAPAFTASSIALKLEKARRTPARDYATLRLLEIDLQILELDTR